MKISKILNVLELLLVMVILWFWIQIEAIPSFIMYTYIALVLITLAIGIYLIYNKKFKNDFKNIMQYFGWPIMFMMFMIVLIS